MIKRLLWLLVLFVCVAPYASAQQGLQGYVVTGTGAQARIVLTGSAIVFHQLTWNVTGTVSSCTVALDTSADGVSWSAGNAIAGQTCTSNGQSALSSSAVFNFVRVNTTAFSGTGSVVITWAGYVATPGGLPSGCTSPGTGAITCTGTVAANALTSTTSVSTGSGASAAGATATGGFACVEAASTGWTSTAGQIYIRCDLATNALDCGINGAADGGCTFGPLIAPTFTSNGTTAGFVDYPQGSTSAAVAPCNTATSICEQAPTAVTSYLLNKLAGPSSGIKLESNAASVLTETSSGDANHSVHLTAQTATKTIYTICPASAGGCNVAGQYRVTWYFNQGGTACGTPTPGQVTFALSWTDNAGAHSAIALPMNDNSSIAVFTSAFKFAASNTTGFASGEFNLWSTGAQPIQVTNTKTECGVGTGTWELTAAVEQVQ